MYLEIYNMNNRWDKDPVLYQAFGESDSSFGRLSYRDAKERKNLLQTLFSKKSAADAHGLIEEKVNKICQSERNVLIFITTRTRLLSSVIPLSGPGALRLIY